MSKARSHGRFGTLLIWICAAALIVSAVFIGLDIYERYRTDKIDEGVRELYKGKEQRRGGFFLIPTARAEEETLEETLPQIHEDFNDLLKENEHVVGWMRAGEKIDYPIMQYDNSYYLSHNFHGDKDSNGALFLDEGNELWSGDDVSLIYGHHMKSGAMFGTLTRYEQYDYVVKHPIISFRTIRDAEEVYYVPIAGFHASMIPGKADYFDIQRFRFSNDHEGGDSYERKSREFEKYLKDLSAWSIWTSPFTADVNDQLLMLVTCSYHNEDGRFMLVCRKLRDGETAEEVEAAFTDAGQGAGKDAMGYPQSFTAHIDVPGRQNILYYAQNDPEWRSHLYSHKNLEHRRTYGEGGCVPTSLSIVLGNLLSSDQLLKLEGISRRGFYITENSISPSLISSKQEKRYIQTEEEYIHYLPLIIGSYAAGNNRTNHLYIGRQGGTSSYFYKEVASFLGIPMKSTRDLNDALEALDHQGYVITSSGGYASPFTVNGHFFVLVSYDDEYIYALDPYVQSEYPRDRKKAIDIVQRGLIRFSRYNIQEIHLNRMYLFYPPTD